MSYKKWILVSAVLFAVSIAIGVTLTLVIPDSIIISLFHEDIAAFQEQLSWILAQPQFLICIFIFIKNVSAMLLSFVFSPILCLMPILSLIVNGGILGFVSVSVAEEKSLGFVLAGLLPHGIFGIPALIIGQAAALSFGAMAMLALIRKGKRSLLLPNLKQNLRYLLLALALLLPAAIIETYLTPLLIT